MSSEAADRSDSERELTKALGDADGSVRSAEELFPLVYRQLHAMARSQLAGERRGHTLQATALVHEAFLRVAPQRAAGDAAAWESRAHFLQAAANAMRRILIDHARARVRLKRGGCERHRIDLAIADALQAFTSESPEDAIALDEAIQRLRESDPRAAEVVHLRFYAGLSMDEIAEILSVSARTVDLDWKLARAKLFQRLSTTNEQSTAKGGAS